MKKHNFNAGPSILADEVLENAAKAIIDFNGSGLSLLSISHRTKDFDDVMAEADALFREMLDIPENYKIFYIGGGASTFFYEVPANFLGKKAGYVNTGVWAKKAMKEAKRYGEVELLASSEDRNFTYIPKGFAIPSDLDYVHITSNNTIYGTEYHEDLVSPVPLIADMSSDILSRPVDVTKYAMIYGGAQKNLAPAGVAFAIIREDMLDKIVRDLPTMVSFRTHVENGSMFNTPPVFPIYVLKETLKGSDTAAIKAATEALTQVFYKLSEKMYQQANPQGGQPGANPGCDPNCQSNDCSKGGDNGQQYYDADYTVVDDDKK